MYISLDEEQAIISATGCKPGDVKPLVEAISGILARKYGLLSIQTGEGYLEWELSNPKGGS